MAELVLCPAPGSRVALSANGGRGISKSLPWSSLLKLGRPLAVLGSVVAVPVDAINRVGQRRPLSHVLQKVVKGTPAIANRDSSAAVSVVAGSPWVAAPVPHRLPRAVSRRGWCSKVGMPMLLSAASATGRGLPSSEVRGLGVSDCSTGALTNPSTFNACFSGSPKNSEASETLPDEINFRCHGTTPSAISVAEMADYIE